MNLSSALQICSEQIAPRGSAHYYSLRLLNQELRVALIGLYSFQHAMLNISSQNLDKQIAQAKLNWWRSEINNLVEGKASHPAAILLQNAVQKYALHLQRFHNIVNIVESHLENKSTIAEKIGSETEIIAAHILDLPDKEIMRHFGIALAWMNKIHEGNLKENIQRIEKEFEYVQQAYHQKTSINLSPFLIRLEIESQILKKIKARKHLKPKKHRLSPLRMYWISLQIAVKCLDS